jgi:apolipoprotein N-acyltransferase
MKNQAIVNPGDRTRRPAWVRRGLALLSGVMLGLSFPPSSAGILASVGLVPLLLAIDRSPRTAISMRTCYLAMLVFHVITLNWTGGYSHGNDVYMMIAGAVTMVFHPFFYLLPLGAYLLARRRMGEGAALAALPLLWVGYEYSHTLSEWSFPWLTLGHSQSYDLAAIQFVSVTGVFGLSLWLLILNVLAYRFVRPLLELGPARGFAAARGAIAGWLIVFVLPHLHGWRVLEEDAVPPGLPPGDSVTVGVVQSNLDPWEKWTSGGPLALNTYLHLTDSLLRVSRHEHPGIVFWPETALPYALLTPQNRFALDEVRLSLQKLDVSVLTGLPHAVYYRDSTEAPPSAKRSDVTGERYDVYNAAAWFQPGTDTVRWYGKMKMVPFAERVPYADMFSWIDFLRWGVGIGGWQIGPDTTVFRDARTGARFSTVICYESVYPDFTASFVRRGAEFLSIITIDSWWGKMSGAYQHHRFAVFRAIETGRWIVRCALGGISCFIDPRGRVYDDTDLMTRAVLWRQIPLETSLTTYVRAGDILGPVTLIGGVTTFLWSLLLPILRRWKGDS